VPLEQENKSFEPACGEKETGHAEIGRSQPSFARGSKATLFDYGCLASDHCATRHCPHAGTHNSAARFES
jgi:hypothetical protein